MQEVRRSSHTKRRDRFVPPDASSVLLSASEPMRRRFTDSPSYRLHTVTAMKHGTRIVCLFVSYDDMLPDDRTTSFDDPRSCTSGFLPVRTGKHQNFYYQHSVLGARPSQWYVRKGGWDGLPRKLTSVSLVPIDGTIIILLLLPHLLSYIWNSRPACHVGRGVRTHGGTAVYLLFV